MGATFTALYNRFFEKKQIRVFMFGVHGAGKSTILYRFRLGKIVYTIPIPGFNFLTIEYKLVNFCFFDVGSQTCIRRVKECFTDTNALIFVVDAHDRERFHEATTELGSLLELDELRDAVVLVLANKQDLPSAMSTHEIAEKLAELSQLRNRKWHIQSTCAITGEGLYEGLDWLSNEVSRLP